jgi:hypothetical protein
MSNSIKNAGLVPQSDFDMKELHPHLKTLLENIYSKGAWDELYVDLTDEIEVKRGTIVAL